MLLEPIQYAILTTPYNTGQMIETNCNSITFYNAGTTIMIIDNISYLPTTSFIVDGNLAEITKQNFALKFTGAGTNNCVVYRKIYS